jgi:integrase
METDPASQTDPPVLYLSAILARDPQRGHSKLRAWTSVWLIRSLRWAGIEDFHPHDCRHTWATWHYAANRDLAALMTLGGWRSVAMVLRYAHVNVSNLAPGVLKLGAVA